MCPGCDRSSAAAPAGSPSEKGAKSPICPAPCLLALAHPSAWFSQLWPCGPPCCPNMRLPQGLCTAARLSGAPSPTQVRPVASWSLPERCLLRAPPWSETVLPQSRPPHSAHFWSACPRGQGRVCPDMVQVPEDALSEADRHPAQPQLGQGRALVHHKHGLAGVLRVADSLVLWAVHDPFRAPRHEHSKGPTGSQEPREAGRGPEACLPPSFSAGRFVPPGPGTCWGVRGCPGSCEGPCGCCGPSPRCPRSLLGPGSHAAQPCEAWASLWRNHESQFGAK